MKNSSSVLLTQIGPLKQPNRRFVVQTLYYWDGFPHLIFLVAFGSLLVFHWFHWFFSISNGHKLWTLTDHRPANRQKSALSLAEGNLTSISFCGFQDFYNFQCARLVLEQKTGKKLTVRACRRANQVRIIKTFEKDIEPIYPNQDPRFKLLSSRI